MTRKRAKKMPMQAGYDRNAADYAMRNTFLEDGSKPENLWCMEHYMEELFLAAMRSGNKTKGMIHLV